MDPHAEVKTLPPVTQLNGVRLQAKDRSRSLGPPLDWTIRQGEYWVVGGLYGAGKTQLISVAGGLEPPPTGQVQIFGEDIAGLGEDELLRFRLRMGIVFDHGGRTFNQLTVFENVALPLRYHRDWPIERIRSTVDALLERTGLTSYAHVSPRNLNQSWQQRVGLARALALDPDVVFLDNPFLGLEFRHRQWWFDFLAQMHTRTGGEETGGRPVTIVVTTDHLQPWVGQGGHFAVLKNRHWHVLGTRADLAADQRNAVAELSLEEI